MEELDGAFERTTVFVAGRGFVPPFDFRFAVFPAQKDDPAVAKMGEVAKAEIHILHKNAHFLDRLEV
jgi:hypothetical protein